MFTRRISQRDYLWVFTVALRTTSISTHGDLLLGNCHFTDHHVLLYLAFVLSKGDDASILIPPAALSTRLNVWCAHPYV
jgi:hypothetical protein